MNYDRFIGLVKSRARLFSEGEAVNAVRATLETLSERLAGEQAQHLASLLPQEIAYFVSPQAVPLDLGLDEFFNRVAIREGSDLPQAVYDARAVMSVVSDTMPAEDIRDMRSRLPAEFGLLFGMEREKRVKKAA